MYILGLTGGIAAGKTTVANMFRALGVPVVDADAIVHQLQGPNTPETKAIAAQFGSQVLTPEGGLSRPALSAYLAQHPEGIKTLEAILHPAVRREEGVQLAQAAQQNHTLAVVDIPLLFEAGANALCDSVAVCDCPMDIRKARAFERPGMTEAKWQTLLSRRWPEEKMRQAAHHLIPTAGTLEATQHAVTTLYTALKNQPSHVWPQKWGTLP